MRQDKKVRYLKRMHYENLVKMCKSDNETIEHKCMCPIEFGELKSGEDYSNDPCSVCRAFIKLRQTKLLDFGRSLMPVNCPCLVLGVDEAMRRTRSAVKTYKQRKI